MQEQKDVYKKNRLLYILEAIFEDIISVLVGGVYLAKVTTAIGLSDSLTGILTSLTCLGCGFQLFSILLKNKRRVKRWVTILHTLNQLFFSMVYFVPFVPISKAQKTILFMVFLLTGHIINYIVYPTKVNWLMSFVENRKRGRFTAKKETIYLICEVAFSLLMGTVVDYYEGIGDVNAAFLVFGLGLVTLMISHTMTLVLTQDKPSSDETVDKISIKQQLKELLRNKNLYKVAFVMALWTIANFVTTPFYGTYQIKELNFSMTFISALLIVTALSHAVFTRPLGKFADKRSFAFMLNIAFAFMLSAFLVNVFTIPSNGKVFYTIYCVLYGMGFAGINSASINLVYDYIDEKNRVGAMALVGTISGVSGFLGTLMVSPLVEYIQANHNIFFGMSVYAQQVVSALGVVLIAIVLVYLNTVVKKMPKNQK